jgi:hypothetical protein
MFERTLVALHPLVRSCLLGANATPPCAATEVVDDRFWVMIQSLNQSIDNRVIEQFTRPSQRPEAVYLDEHCWSWPGYAGSPLHLDLMLAMWEGMSLADILNWGLGRDAAMWPMRALPDRGH